MKYSIFHMRRRMLLGSRSARDRILMSSIERQASGGKKRPRRIPRDDPFAWRRRPYRAPHVYVRLNKNSICANIHDWYRRSRPLVTETKEGFECADAKIGRLLKKLTESLFGKLAATNRHLRDACSTCSQLCSALRFLARGSSGYLN
jgi:hypothetical protein